MPIKTLEIKNYQSHESTKLCLGNFTVLVGPTSSGKSAVIRALRALTSNQSGKDFISYGQVTAQISATTDKGTVVLTKGKPEDSYVIVSNSDPDNPHKYTKLGGQVPEDVTKFLGIQPKDAINFAGQFDMPYLLRNSAPEVARTLGELTNVSAIFEASREALRRKSSFSGTLKTRQSDLEIVDARLESQFENLPARVEAIGEAENALLRAQEASSELSKLNDLLLTLQTATARLKAARKSTDVPLPETAEAEALLSKSQALEVVVNTLSKAGKVKKQAEERISEADTEIGKLDKEYELALQEAGTCPVCKQSTKGVHIHA